MLACPKRLATLATETPAYRRRDAWVCRNPCTEITGIDAASHLRLSKLLIVELKMALFSLQPMKIGVCASIDLINSEN